MAWKRLSALDSMFLELEDECTPLHVGSVLLFDGRLERSELERVLAAGAQSVPRACERIWRVPLFGHRFWVPAELDVRRHLFSHRLPAGTPLEALVGDLFARPLDPARPLWEIHVIDGLPDGRLAIVTKNHHSMLDGQAGVQALIATLSGKPAAAETQPAHRPPRARGRRHWVRDAVRGTAAMLRSALPPASPTPFNRWRIGRHRAIGWRRFPLADLHAIGERLGGTINDVLLCAIAGGLADWLLHHSIAPTSLELRAMIPVGHRHRGETFATGNLVSMMLARLPAGERDPERRLAMTRATTQSAKGSRQSQASTVIERLADWTAPPLLALAVRALLHLRPFNLVVTNVPGPRQPLEALGSRLLEFHPLLPLTHQLGLGIALLSYDDGLSCCAVADPQAMSDLPFLMDRICDQVHRLQAAAQVHLRRAG